MSALYYIVQQKWRKHDRNIPVQPSQTCELVEDRIRECHGWSACSVPAEDTQNKTHAGMRVKHYVLYLHHPLKHMGQRKEGDEYIFTVGLLWALDTIGREIQVQEGQENINWSNRINLSETDIRF